MEQKQIMDNYLEQQIWQESLTSEFANKDIVKNFDVRRFESVVPTINYKKVGNKSIFTITSRLTGVSHKYDEITYFYDGFAKVKRNGESLFVDYLGRESQIKSYSGHDIFKFAIGLMDIDELEYKYFYDEMFVDAVKKACEIKIINANELGVYLKENNISKDITYFADEIDKKLKNIVDPETNEPFIKDKIKIPSKKRNKQNINEDETVEDIMIRWPQMPKINVIKADGKRDLYEIQSKYFETPNINKYTYVCPIFSKGFSIAQKLDGDMVYVDYLGRESAERTESGLRFYEFVSDVDTLNQMKPEFFSDGNFVNAINKEVERKIEENDKKHRYASIKEKLEDLAYFKKYFEKMIDEYQHLDDSLNV